jgi:enoyl-CoA hydratase/carnithine racemase
VNTAAPAAQVLCETRNHIAFVTLNRPAALNALSLDMVVRLRALLTGCAEDPDVHAVLLQGAGDKAFCAGGDIRALYHSFRERGTLHREFFVAEYPLDHWLYGYPKPYVVLMDGITMGGGMGLAQSSSLRIVGERTRMAMPEVAIGFFPDVGASHFLSRLPGGLGTYLAMTGAPIRAADALHCGLADVYLPPAALASLAADLAALSWTGERHAALASLIHARAAPAPEPSPGLRLLRPAIDTHFSHASAADILQSLATERRPAYADWAAQTGKLIRSRSPTLVSVAFSQLRRGKTMGLADCFRMELGMTQQCFEQGDFMEGVRAMLIDKDHSPHWNPGRIEDVTEAMVEPFFRQRWTREAHPLADLA